MFPAGRTFPGSTACSSYSTIDDLAVEGVHRFAAMLSSVNPSGATISLPSASASIVIEDNDGKVDTTITA